MEILARAPTVVQAVVVLCWRVSHTAAGLAPWARGIMVERVLLPPPLTAVAEVAAPQPLVVTGQAPSVGTAVQERHHLSLVLVLPVAEVVAAGSIVPEQLDQEVQEAGGLDMSRGTEPPRQQILAVAVGVVERQELLLEVTAAPAS